MALRLDSPQVWRGGSRDCVRATPLSVPAAAAAARSGRRTFRVAGDLFQAVQPELRLAQLFLYCAERGHDLGVLGAVRLAVCRAGELRDGVAAFLVRDDDAFGAEHVEPVADGHRGDAVLPGQLALDG